MFSDDLVPSDVKVLGAVSHVTEGSRNPMLICAHGLKKCDYMQTELESFAFCSTAQLIAQ